MIAVLGTNGRWVWGALILAGILSPAGARAFQFQEPIRVADTVETASAFGGTTTVTIDHSVFGCRHKADILVLLEIIPKAVMARGLTGDPHGLFLRKFRIGNELLLLLIESGSCTVYERGKTYYLVSELGPLIGVAQRRVPSGRLVPVDLDVETINEDGIHFTYGDWFSFVEPR